MLHKIAHSVSLHTGSVCEYKQQALIGVLRPVYNVRMLIHCIARHAMLGDARIKPSSITPRVALQKAIRRQAPPTQGVKIWADHVLRTHHLIRRVLPPQHPARPYPGQNGLSHRDQCLPPLTMRPPTPPTGQQRQALRPHSG